MTAAALRATTTRVLAMTPAFVDAGGTRYPVIGSRLEKSGDEEPVQILVLQTGQPIQPTERPPTT